MAMIPLKLVIILLFLETIAAAYETYDIPYVVDSHRSKCECLPHRSLHQKNKCYTLLPDYDENIRFPNNLNEVYSLNVTGLLREHKLVGQDDILQLRRGKYVLTTGMGIFNLVTYELPKFCPAGSEMFDNFCYFFDSRLANHSEAMSHCVYKKMRLFQPHSDRDIKNIIELTRFSNVKEILIAGTWNIIVGWNSNDQYEIDFFRWSDSENTLWKSGPNIMNTILYLQNDRTSAGHLLGYIDVARPIVELPFVCVSEVSPFPIEPLKSTEKTTTPTKRTTTTTRKTTTAKPCGVWSEWTGECYADHCGYCNHQTRTRINRAGCNELSFEHRKCLNDVCLYPCIACMPECTKKITSAGEFFCSQRTACSFQPTDGFNKFLNETRYPWKPCPPEISHG